MNGWLVAVSESHVMTFIFWPLVLFMRYGGYRQRARAVVFLALAAASLLSYESMVMQGPVLAGLALGRARGTKATERVLWNVLTGWFVLGTAIAAYSIVYPRSVLNRDTLGATITPGTCKRCGPSECARGSRQTRFERF